MVDSTSTLPKGETARIFRERMAQALEAAGVGRGELAARIGIDRSTLSQILSPANDRLPRADTVAALASELQVSLDWLLGLSQEQRRGASILLESLQFRPSPNTPVDEGLQRWCDEARGYKIRYVPATLPDLAKTRAVMAHEYQDYVSRETEEALASAQEKLAYTRQPETDMEICLRIQDMRGFAFGEGIWQGLSLDARVQQLSRLIALHDELYPSLRMFFYDGRTHYSVPYTVFGPVRAAVYVGQMYFVFNTKEHIRVLTRHFDDLVRAAVVQANDTPRMLAALRDEVTKAEKR